MPNFPKNIWTGSECCPDCPDPSDPCNCDEDCGCISVPASFTDPITPGTFDSELKEIYRNVYSFSCETITEFCYCVAVTVSGKTFNKMYHANGDNNPYFYVAVQTGYPAFCSYFPAEQWVELMDFRDQFKLIELEHSVPIKIPDDLVDDDTLEITVENTAQTITYIDTVDYEITTVGTDVFLTALPTGAIANMQEIRVTYTRGREVNNEQCIPCPIAEMTGSGGLSDVFWVEIDFADSSYNTPPTVPNMGSIAVMEGDVTYCGLVGWNKSAECYNNYLWDCYYYCGVPTGAGMDYPQAQVDCYPDATNSSFGIELYEVCITTGLYGLDTYCGCGTGCYAYSDICNPTDGCTYGQCCGAPSCNNFEFYELYESARSYGSSGTNGVPGYFAYGWSIIAAFIDGVVVNYTINACETSCPQSPAYTGIDVDLYNFFDEASNAGTFTPDFSLNEDSCYGFDEERDLQFFGLIGTSNQCIDYTNFAIGFPPSPLDGPYIYLEHITINGVQYDTIDGANVTIPCCEEDPAAVMRIWIFIPIRAQNTVSCQSNSEGEIIGYIEQTYDIAVNIPEWDNC